MDDEITPAVAREINEVSTDQNRHWTIKFEENFEEFVSDQKKKQQEKEKQPKKRENTNIYKIPADIRKNFDDLYAPCKVSFGPYHYGRPSCKSTEAIKERVVFHSLVVFKKTIDDYIKDLRGVLKDLKDKYDDLYPTWKGDDEDFLRLMIFYGCFLLEVLRAANSLSLWFRLILDEFMGVNNPIWDIDGISPNKLMGYYRHDMVLLENQLPMLVLQKLFAVQTGKPIEEAKNNLHRRILRFFFPGQNNLHRPWFTRERDMEDESHVLQLYRHGLLYGEQNRGNTFWPDFHISGHPHLTMITRMFHIIYDPVIELLSPAISYLKRSLFGPIRYLKESLTCLQTSSATDSDFSFPSATELHKVGIRFTTSKTRNLTDISFNGRTLRLPRICVDNGTKSMFLNIIAFERSSQNQQVSWYIYFMSMLIQGEDDVRLLQSRGIINIKLVRTNKVAELFNMLTKVIVLNPWAGREYHVAGKMMTERYIKLSTGWRRELNEWRRELRQNYLKNRWAIFSIIGGFLLFGLTALQTVYTILGYYSFK